MPSVRDKMKHISELHDTTYYYRELARYVYQGYVPYGVVNKFGGEFSNKYCTFHEYTEKGKQRYRKSANLPKMIGEYIVKNMYAEYPEINIENESAMNRLKDILDENNFNTLEKEHFETMYHLGGRFFVPYIRKGKLKINYVNGNRGFITSVKDGKPNEAVFVTIKKKEKKGLLGKVVPYYYTTLEWHYEAEDGTRKVKTEMYASTKRGELSSNVTNEIAAIFGDKVKDEEFTYNIPMPTFVYQKNPIKNNKDLDSNEGLGALINSLDQLMMVDEAVDAISTEINYGKLKTIVPSSAMEKIVSDDGKLYNHYNPHDPDVLAYDSPMGEHKPEAYAPTLRIQDQVLALNSKLDLIAVNIGISAGTFRFDGKSVATATQVITEKSDTARTIKMYEQSNTESFKDLFMLLQALSVTEIGVETLPPFTREDISIMWQDNVLVDDESKSDRMQQDALNGVLPKFRYLMWQYDLTEEEAKQWIAEQQLEDSALLPLSEEFETNNPDNVDILDVL